MEKLSDLLARVKKLSLQAEEERRAASQTSTSRPEKEHRGLSAPPLSTARPVAQASAIHQPDTVADTTTPASPAKVITISTRRRRQIETMILAREDRERGEQQLVYSARPFVLCSLPVRRPKNGALKHIRKNGKFFLRITGDVDLGLPFGQDRLIPIWVATLALHQNSRLIRFASAADGQTPQSVPAGGR